MKCWVLGAGGCVRGCGLCAQDSGSAVAWSAARLPLDRDHRHHRNIHTRLGNQPQKYLMQGKIFQVSIHNIHTLVPGGAT